MAGSPKSKQMAPTLQENEIEPHLMLDDDPAASSKRELHEASAEQFGADLGIWLTAVANFAGSRGVSRVSRRLTPESAPAMSRILQSGLVHSTLIASKIHAIEISAKGSSDGHARAIVDAIREPAIIGESCWDRPFTVSEFASWSKLIDDRLSQAASSKEHFQQMANAEADRLGRELICRFGPGEMDPPRILTEIKLILRKFGKIFVHLDAVKRLLTSDGQLKPAILIFISIESLCSDLARLLESRSAELRAIDPEFADLLDGAAYVSSIETRKVFDQELSGVMEMRSIPSVFARFEAAHALLLEGSQHTVISIAKHLNGRVDAADIYPYLSVKRDSSILLQSDLRSLAADVAAAETSADEASAEMVGAKVKDFLSGSAKYLYYKDIETIERFSEEIEFAGSRGEIQQILHRFNAYLETLLGQVSLRAVLTEGDGQQASL